MTPFLVFLVGGLAAWLMTGVIRSHAIRRGMLDVPNERSSHVVPTPRGGGIAIVFVLLGTIIIETFTNALPIRAAIGVGVGAFAIALIGWLDDARRLRGGSVMVRAAVHLGAATWAVLWLGGFDSIDLGKHTISLWSLGSPLAIFLIAWSTNLYNFMDGIDGIAGVQAVVAALVLGICLWTAGVTGFGLTMLATGGASAGFLLWNWSPARIFMGDVGSGVLGFTFGAVAVAAENAGAFPLAAWVILLGAFILDTTVTLVRRLVRGERVYEAHRAHAYQRLVAAGWGHDRVAASVGVVALALAALSLLAWRIPAVRLWTLGVAALVLVAMYAYVEHVAPMRRFLPDRKPVP